MKKKITILLVKIAIGVALLAFIIWKMAPGWDESRIIITDLFRHRIYSFIAGILCFGLVVCLGTFRWKFLLRAHQVDLRFGEVIKLFFVGHFFSQFMPGGIAGGDIVKSFYVSTHTDDRKHEAVTTIFIDRITGIFGLFGVWETYYLRSSIPSCRVAANSPVFQQRPAQKNPDYYKACG